MTDQDQFREALRAIQEAQSLADHACRCLCSVVDKPIGGSTAYAIACRLSDQIKRDWHRVDRHMQCENKGKLISILQD